MPTRYCLPVILAFVFCTSMACAGFLVASGGQARCAIVINRQFAGYADMLNAPPDAGQRRQAIAGYAFSAVMGAMELADYIQKATGARPPILVDTNRQALQAFPGRIFVGRCEQTRALAGADALEPEAFIIRTVGRDLFIVGGDVGVLGSDVHGTLNAVYDLLEAQVGVRWLFPGDLGEVVPPADTMCFPAIDIQRQPVVLQRHIRDNHLGDRKRVEVLLQRWGVATSQWEQTFSQAVTGPWFRRQRLGRRADLAYGHSFAGWWEKYGREHPEYFALQPDGSRTQKPGRERLCVSEPRLWDAVARDRIAQLKASPRLLCVSISPNDGGPNQFCMCERCRNWDPPNAPRVVIPGLVDPQTSVPLADYPSLTDRYVRFYNEVARRIAREMPDRKVGVYAYSYYRTPPVEVRQLETNIVVGFVGLDADMIREWGRLASVLLIRPNDLLDKGTFGMPRNRAPYLAERIRLAVHHRARAFDFDSCTGNWGTQGLAYYITAKMLWNPEADAEALTRDYCCAAYGPGAPAMEEFFAILADLDHRLRTEGRYQGRKVNAHLVLPDYYSPRLFKELQDRLDRATTAIGAANARARARVAMAEEGVAYARKLIAVLEAAREADSRDALATLHAAKNDFEAFERTHALSWSVAVLHNERFLWDAIYRGELAAQERAQETD